MILRRYLMLETFKSQLGVLFVLLLIFVSQKFIWILSKAISGEIPTDLVLTILYLNLPPLCTLMLPISFFLAILFAHGRLHSESEIVAMTSCGYSPNRVLKSMLFLSFFTFAIASFNSLYLAPAAENEKIIVIENAESDAGTATLIEGQFHKTSDTGGVIYVEKYKAGKKLEKIFAAHWPEDPTQAPSVITSLAGQLQDNEDGTWLSLNNGQRYAGRAGENEFDNTKFERYEIHIANREVQSKKRGVNALSSLELLKSKDIKYQAELQWRIAISLSILLLTFMAVPLSRVNPRQGQYSKLLPALALYLTYFLLLSTTKSLIEDSVLPVLSLWGVQVIFLAVGIILHMQTLGRFGKVSLFKTKSIKLA